MVPASGRPVSSHIIAGQNASDRPAGSRHPTTRRLARAKLVRNGRELDGRHHESSGDIKSWSIFEKFVPKRSFKMSIISESSATSS